MKKTETLKARKEKRIKREADDAEFEKLIAEHNELLNYDGKGTLIYSLPF